MQLSYEEQKKAEIIAARNKGLAGTLIAVLVVVSLIAYGSVIAAPANAHKKAMQTITTEVNKGIADGRIDPVFAKLFIARVERGDVTTPEMALNLFKTGQWKRDLRTVETQIDALSEAQRAVGNTIHSRVEASGETHCDQMARANVQGYSTCMYYWRNQTESMLGKR